MGGARSATASAVSIGARVSPRGRSRSFWMWRSVVPSTAGSSHRTSARSACWRNVASRSSATRMRMATTASSTCLAPILPVALTNLPARRLFFPRHLPRPGDRLRAVEHLQLAEDVRDVVADRLRTQRQHLGDLWIALAVHDERQHLPLAFGQFWKRARRDDGAHVCEVLHEALRDGWAEDRFACRDDIDRPDDVLFSRAFEQIASRPRAHRAEDRIVVFEHRENQNRNLWIGLGDAACRLDA